MRHHPTRRSMPVERSILWKPLRDSHYIVASLQPADGGRLKIFARQQALAEAQTAAHAAHGKPAFGLLVGHVYTCSTTKSDYVVIDSIAPQHTLADEDLNRAIDRAIANRPEATDMKVVGWYRSVASVEPRPSDSIAQIHAAHFTQPWQTTLVLGENSDGGGAFLFRDSVNSRWFYAPFYELAEHDSAGGPKSTCISWPQYMTAEPVVSTRLEAAPPIAPEPPITLQPQPRRAMDRLFGTDHANFAEASAEQHHQPSWSSPTASKPRERVPIERRPPIAADTAPATIDREVQAAPHNGVADLPLKPIEAPAGRGARRPSTFGDRLVRRPPKLDDPDQRRAARGGMRVVRDDDDTTRGDRPDRFVETARAEGFFVVARFDTQDEEGRAETMWVMNEPQSGILLTLATTEEEVLDASIHYNRRTDEAGMRRTPFPEHRHAESQTIYVRETCVDALRAACRRLRATKALVREWKVTPAITFLTPGEWLTIGNSGTVDPRGAVRALNSTRIAAIPEEVRAQFGLSVGETTPQTTPQ